jgi:hypothetical protein
MAPMRADRRREGQGYVEPTEIRSLSQGSLRPCRVVCPRRPPSAAGPERAPPSDHRPLAGGGHTRRERAVPHRSPRKGSLAILVRDAARDTAALPQSSITLRWAKALLGLLVACGLLFFAAVQSDRSDRPACGAFAIGRSAIGGCDGIGAPPRPLDLLARLVREVLERARGEAAGLYNYLKKVELDPVPPPGRHT